MIKITRDGVTKDGRSFEAGETVDIRITSAMQLIKEGCAEAIKTMTRPPKDKAVKGPAKKKGVTDV